jgi:hypothetical protein
MRREPPSARKRSPSSPPNACVRSSTSLAIGSLPHMRPLRLHLRAALRSKPSRARFSRTVVVGVSAASSDEAIRCENYRSGQECVKHFARYSKEYFASGVHITEQQTSSSGVNNTSNRPTGLPIALAASPGFRVPALKLGRMRRGLEPPQGGPHLSIPTIAEAVRGLLWTWPSSTARRSCGKSTGGATSRRS